MALVLLSALAAEPWRETRLAMGTVVGITLAEAPPDGVTAQAWAAIEAGEAELSEWRPGSVTSRLNRGEDATFGAAALGLFRLAARVEEASDGAFSLTWAGGSWGMDGDRVWVEEGRLGLGAILKGWLVDRAAEALRAEGVADFAIDAAGDVRAAGHADARRAGWPVSVVDEEGRVLRRLRLHDEALSTSGGGRQPGHVRDPRTGEVVDCARTVSVVAPDAATADALATAAFARCGRLDLSPFGARIVVRRG